MGVRYSRPSSSRTSHSRSVIPTAIAGVTRSDLWTRQKLENVYQTETAAQWFSHFLLKAFVSLVSRRVPMRVPWKPLNSSVSNQITNHCRQVDRFPGAI